MTIGPPQPSIEFSPHTSYQSFTCPSKHIFPLFSKSVSKRSRWECGRSLLCFRTSFRFPSKRRCPSARNGLRIHDMTSETRTPSQEAKLLDVSWNVEEVRVSHSLVHRPRFPCVHVHVGHNLPEALEERSRSVRNLPDCEVYPVGSTAAWSSRQELLLCL